MLKSISLSEAIQKTTKLLTGGGITVTQQGVRPFVARNPDGTVKAINIPVIPAAPTSDFLAAMQGFVDQEVAGALYTDPVQSARRVREVRSAIQPRMIPMFEKLLESIERVRVERLMAEEFQGSVRNVANALDFVMDKGGREAIKAAVEADNKQAIIAHAVPLWLRASAGNNYVSLFISEVGLAPYALSMTLAFPSIADRFEELNNSAASVDLARDITLAWTTEDKSEPEPEEGTGDGEAEEGEEPETDDDAEGEAEGEPEEGEADPDDDAEEEAEGEAEDADDAEGDPDDDAEEEEADPTDDPMGKSDESDEKGDDGGGRKRKAMTEALSKISQSHRDLLSDHKNRKLSYAEIAKKRGLSEVEVREGLAEANKSLTHHYRAGRA